ncbi:MAG: hypothetical protein IJK31_02365 [Ruminococcus sp.]|nr:hypothetical protein [Ruminococcus sp.]
MKLKPNKTPKHVFEKIQKKVKAKGATSKWNVTVEDKSVAIDFGDGASETFCLDFIGNQADGSCKVEFPMDGELFENEKKSEWKIFIDLLHSIKPMCSEISVDDDFSIAGDFFNSLDYKFTMRELNADEMDRLSNIFGQGYTSYEAFLLKIFSDDTQRKYPEDLACAINPGTKLIEPFPEISALWETYIFETSTLKKKCLREIYKDDVRFKNGVKVTVIGDPPAEVYAFSLGVGRLFSSYHYIDNEWGRGANVTKYFYDKFLPVFENTDEYGKCKLAYQFMLSIYDYCKFKFVGKDVINRMIDEYEKSIDS